MRRTLEVKDFKSHEVYSAYRVPNGLAFFIRCDGRNFRKICTVLKLKKPFDERLIRILISAAREVFQEGFNAILAYIFSDEINFLFIKNVPFNRRVEKLVSLISSLVSSRFSLEVLKLFKMDLAIAFDARIVPMYSSEVIEYLAWRQLQCFRNCLNCYAHYSLIEKGYSPKEVAESLRGLKAESLLEIISRVKGVRLNDIPLWQRRGVLLYWEEFHKIGRNPLTGDNVLAIRRKLKEEWNLPLFSSQEGRIFLEKILREQSVIHR